MLRILTIITILPADISEIFLYGILIVYAIFLWRMILDAWNNEPTSRWGWILFIFYIPFIGPITYYFAKKRPRDRIDSKFKS
ncbi:MAG: PLDc N-terminal domain-containing protein [Bacteroidetes bacterium]|nr:PLDc N-terminal domain-containing protein [Bacteroidota bacterium]